MSASSDAVDGTGDGGHLGVQRPATEYLSYLIFRLHRAMGRAFETIALRNGLTQPELLACLVLAEGEPISNAQLARRTFVTSQASHDVVAALDSRGLVSRVSHETNRRVRLILLSENGWRAVEECSSELLELEARMLDGHGESGQGPVLPSTLQPTTLRPVLQEVAATLAGGWFGDVDAEAEAGELRAKHKGGFPAE